MVIKRCHINNHWSISVTDSPVVGTTCSRLKTLDITSYSSSVSCVRPSSPVTLTQSSKSLCACAPSPIAIHLAGVSIIVILSLQLGPDNTET